MKFRRLPALLLLIAAGVASAQRWGRRGNGMEEVRTAREVPSGSTGTPTWEYPEAFKADVFTFTRIRYERGGGGWGRGGWATDLPDSDLNLSWRLQQMTSLKVDPDTRIIRPTDPELMTFPFVYIAEPGGLSFSEEETLAMRKYLENGGFLLLAVTVAVAAGIVLRTPVKMNIIRDRGNIVRELEDGRLENVYRVQIMNTREDARSFVLSARGIDGVELVVPETQPVRVGSAGARVVPLELRVPAGSVKAGSTPVWLRVEATDDASVAREEKTVFISR
jgi:hypothetical protein